MVNVKNAAELYNEDYVMMRLSAVHRELEPDLLQADYEQVRLELAEENVDRGSFIQVVSKSGYNEYNMQMVIQWQ